MSKAAKFCLFCCVISFIFCLVGITDLKYSENLPDFFGIVLSGYFLYFCAGLIFLFLYAFSNNVNDRVKLRFLVSIFVVLVLYFLFMVTNKTGLYLPHEAPNWPMLIKMHDFQFFKYVFVGAGPVALHYLLVHKS